MRRLAILALLALLTTVALSAPLRAGEATPADFQPDPRSVERYGPAYRYPQSGWIVLHIEGEPYERGYQHGRLMAPEILGYLRCFAALRSPKMPADGWRNTRTLINAVFVRRVEKEFLEEMKGIADGANAVGARFDGRPLDVVDIVGLNAWPEILTLDSALDATPTGLEAMHFPHPQLRTMPKEQEGHCSAFAATGPATADGKIVFGHITMFSLYPSLFYNVWLDVKPTRGHRVLMQSYPAGIQSGMDYYLNDAGLLVAETTITQTRYNIDGLSVASRIRQALQYADSIDQAADILRKSNNGLYTNEWLLADIKTNEIAMFELGTAKSHLYRSSKNEWFGGTEGFYWGCNNTKDREVRLETVASVEGTPANVVWRPTDRDKLWIRLYKEHKGKIDAGFGKLAFTMPPLAAYHSVDAKFTTSDMAKDLKTWALFGPPLGRTWRPKAEQRMLFPEIRPMVSNPWTVLHSGAPARIDLAGASPVDVPEKISAHDTSAQIARNETDLDDRDDSEIGLEAVWHGTLLPKTDADVWLASAFADYQHILSRHNAPSAKRSAGEPGSKERDELATALFAYRSGYLAAARAGTDVPLARTRADDAGDGWYKIASGKGVLLLHELRRLMGAGRFDKMMDEFGRAHAGQETTTKDFVAAAEKAAGRSLEGFFEVWLGHTGLPSLRLEDVAVDKKGSEYLVHGVVRADNVPEGTKVSAVVETKKGTATITVKLQNGGTSFTVPVEHQPLKLCIDPNDEMAKANGGAFSVDSFYQELNRTLIVYGTADEVSTNHEAADLLQRAIVEFWSNVTVPVKADRDVTEGELKSHHVLLIGRPDSNRWVERFQQAWPVKFGSRSFSVGQDEFAHALSAVIAAGDNPLNPRYSAVVFAGLSAESTRSAATKLLHRRGESGGEVVILRHGEAARRVTVPPSDLARTLPESERISRSR